MKIHVIRHAQTNTNKQGIMGGIEEDINETGIIQCHEVAQKIKNMDFDLIISSPATRTKHVTELINVNNLPVIYDDRLIERDIGKYEGCVYKNIDAFDFWNYYPKKYLDLESMQSVCERVDDFIRFIQEKHSDKKLLIVTHAGTALGFYCNEHGIPEDGDLSNFGQGNCEIREYDVDYRRRELEEKIAELQGLFKRILAAKQLEKEYQMHLQNKMPNKVIGGETR